MVTFLKNLHPEKESSGDIELDILDPEGISIQKFSNKIEFTGQKKRLRFRLKINAVPFTVFGEYSYQIGTKESTTSAFETVAMIPLEIKEKK